MAKKQTVDHAAGASPKTAARRKGRQASQKTSETRPAAPTVAAELGDRTKDNASAAEALPVAVTPALENGGQAQKPDDLGGVSEENSGSSHGTRATPQPSPEIKVQGARANTKRAQLIGLLERPKGASVGDIGERLGWLPHTVRAALTGLRHAGREVSRDKNAEGRSIYRLTPVEASKR